MAGLSSIVNLGYHGTIPERAASIAASGFKGGTFPTWAGKGNIFTSNPNVASRYGTSQLGVVTSAKNLTSPIGGGIGQGGISFGKEVVTSPGQATKGMNLYNKLMSGAYTSSPTAQRLLQTGTTAIKNPTNWARALGIPLSALTGILSSTPVNADEVEWEKQLMKNQQFKQQQLMNRRKQDMQQRIREAEAAAATKAKAKAKAKADAAAQASQRQADQARISRAYREETGGQAGSYAPGGGSGAHAADASGSTYSDPFDPGGGEARGGFIDGTNRRRNYLDGGLIDFFRYGGFIG